MRYDLVPMLTLAWLVLAGSADAQQFRRVAVDNNGVQVGFAGVTVEGFKPGLWTPVLVKFVDNPVGNILLPIEADGSLRGELLVETADNAGVLNVYPQKFNLAPNKPMQVLTYTKLASSYGQIKVTVKAGGESFNVRTNSPDGLELHQHLYLSLGDRLADLPESLSRMAGKNDNDGRFGGRGPRHAAFENNPQNLPDLWFGYNGVDLALLVTSSDKFLDKLIGDRQASPELQALAEWVRRGGRLVVSIAPSNREKVHRFLTSAAWQPALPALLPLDAKTIPLGALGDLQSWVNAKNPPPGGKAGKGKEAKVNDRLGVHLEQNPGVSVLCWETRDREPLIVRFPHGIGSITLLAFDVKDSFITSWDGRYEFWQALVKKLAPASGDGVNPFNVNNAPVWGSNGGDPISILHDELESFDTATISFGWVALFILIYILVVGPLDYIILKHVFKRLELTWLTFPAIVLTVSVLAYFTAYAVKGQDLKVNKVDLIDIDMRSALSPDLQPAAATAYGTTWFAIQSPRIQNYTIGIEPVLRNWQPGIPASAKPVEPTMSWLGRPDFGGMGGGRGASPGLFTRSYSYEANAVGLRGVPIPVWTTKAFTASWAVPFERLKPPFESNMTYVVGKSTTAISGTLTNQLAVDLHDVGLISGSQFYPLPDLPKGATAQIKLEALAGQELTTWAQQPQVDDRLHPVRGRGQFFLPTSIIHNLMFHEKVGINRNHASRGLDWSWRLATESSTRDAGVKEVILVAHVGRASGPLEELHASNDPVLPTHLWLGQLPGTPVAGEANNDKGTAFQPRPKMEGTLIQETYLRVILPVAPRK